MASSIAHNIYNVSNTNNNHKPRSHSKRQRVSSIPKITACAIKGRVAAVSCMSAATACSISSSTYSLMEATSSTSTLSFSPPTSCLPLLWREIQGCNNWDDLLDPLHPLLRDEIVRYGEFVTACYEAFDLNPSSRRYLNCKFGKKSLFREVGLGGSGYEVTKYIYATPDVNIPIPNGDSCTSRWVGYVAVSSDEATRRLGRRDIVITFRGTVTNPEWIANLMSSLTPARLDPHDSQPDVKVESGFLSLYTAKESACKFGVPSCREQLLSEVSRLLTKYKGENMSITIAGHSMGSSLALLLAYDIAELGLNQTNTMDSTNQDDRYRVPVTVFSFGGPRVGNSAFKERCEELGIKVLRIVNVNDPITKLPGVVFNENFRVLGGRYESPWSCSCYAHVGVELALDFFNVQNPSCVHDLESYLSLLKSPKKPEIKRVSIMPSVDLLQRAQDFLLSAQNINSMIPWRDAAVNMANLVSMQSHLPDICMLCMYGGGVDF